MLIYVFFLYLLCHTSQSYAINSYLSETSTIFTEYSTLEQALEAELSKESPKENIFLRIDCGNFSIITPKNISNAKLTITYII